MTGWTEGHYDDTEGIQTIQECLSDTESEREEDPKYGKRYSDGTALSGSTLRYSSSNAARYAVFATGKEAQDEDRVASVVQPEPSPINPHSRAKSHYLSPDRTAFRPAFCQLLDQASDVSSSCQLLMNATIPTFVAAELDGLSCRQLVVLVGEEHSFHATTCEEYVTNRWPDHAGALLDVFDHLGALAPGAASDARRTQIGPSTTRDIEVTARYLDTRTAASPDGVLRLNLAAQADDLAVTVEALSWLFVVMQPVAGTVVAQSCSVRTSRRSTSMFYLTPRREVEVRQSGLRSNCWLPVAPNTPAAAGCRPGALEGLEVSFELLCYLCGIQYEAIDDGGVVLYGFDSMVYPVRAEGECLAWHFQSRKKEKQSDSSLGGDRLKIDDLNILKEYRRHFLGLWAEPTVTLGTALSDATRIGWTTAREKGHEYLPNGREIGGSVTLPRLINITATQTYKIAKSRRSPYTAGEMDFMTHLDSRVHSPVILYCVSEKRAWMVSFVSVLLHLGRARASSQEERLGFHIPPCAAAADGGVAAFEVVQSCRSQPMRIPRKDEVLDDEGKNNTVQEYLRKVWAALDSAERERNKARGVFKDDIIGYEMADIAKFQPKLRMKSCTLDGIHRRNSWGPLLNEVDIVLFYERMDDPIIRGGANPQDGCAGDRLPSIPKGFNLLTASLPCLLNTSQRYNKGTAIQFLTQKHLWHNSAHSRYLFKNCGCKKRYPCNKLQELRTSASQTIRPSRRELLKHPSGAVVFRYSDDMNTIHGALKAADSERKLHANPHSLGSGDSRPSLAISTDEAQSARSDSGYSSESMRRASAVPFESASTLLGTYTPSTAASSRTLTPLRTPTWFWDDADRLP